MIHLSHCFIYRLVGLGARRLDERTGRRDGPVGGIGRRTAASSASGEGAVGRRVAAAAAAALAALVARQRRDRAEHAARRSYLARQRRLTCTLGLPRDKTVATYKFIQRVK
jgi:hypothetical protein